NCIIYQNFFFQAEDGIRDRNVTGVQTCALPILSTKAMDQGAGQSSSRSFLLSGNPCRVPPYSKSEEGGNTSSSFWKNPGKYFIRSEERRVGKECIYWWSL